MSQQKLVIHKQFVETESPQYVGTYIRQHTDAPSPPPQEILTSAFTDTPAVTVAWNRGWHIEPFRGWNDE